MVSRNGRLALLDAFDGGHEHTERLAVGWNLLELLDAARVFALGRSGDLLVMHLPQ